MPSPLRPYRKVALTAVAVFLVVAGGIRMAGSQSYPVYDDEHIPLTVLNRWWCPNYNGQGVDHITALTTEDHSSQCILEGAVAYVLSDPQNHPFGGSTSYLYRLYHSVANNHMDSGSTSEGGYTLDAGLFGYAWQTQGPGMVALNRYYGLSPATQDDQPTGLSTDSALFSLWGYGTVGSYGFGYPRFGSQYQVYVTVPTAYEGINPATIQNQMVLKSNKAAGGIVSQVWYNGFQFLNNFDFAGRQLQHGLFKTTSWGDFDNPTEGGDKWGGPAGCPSGGAPPNYLRNCGQGHGSPLLAFAATGTQLQTEVHPLDYVPERVSPMYGSIDRPVMWSGKLRKDVTTNFQGDPQITQWKSFVTVPKLTPNMGDYGPIGGHFVSELTKFWYDDVSIGTSPSDPQWTAGLVNFSSRLTVARPSIDILPESWCTPQPASHPCKLDPKATTWGMIMLSTDDEGKVIGLYYHANHPGGNKFGALKTFGTDTGEYAFAQNAIRVGHIYWGNDVPPGEYPKSQPTSDYFQQPYNTWVSYVIVGDSLNEVRTRARWLKGQGY